MPSDQARCSEGGTALSRPIMPAVSRLSSLSQNWSRSVAIRMQERWARFT